MEEGNNEINYENIINNEINNEIKNEIKEDDKKEPNIELKKEISNESNDKSNEDNEIIDDYDYNEEDEDVDMVEKGQEEILEEMFLRTKESKEENKIDLYLDIINSDETRQKIWSFKSYQQICLLYIEFEHHTMFLLYYQKLKEIANHIDYKYLKPHIDACITLFLNEIFSHCNASMSHWLEDLTEGFNRFEKNKVINMFEAVINLKIIQLSKGGKYFDSYKILDDDNKKIELDSGLLDFIRDREELERLADEYFIKECGCDPKHPKK